MMGFLNTIQSVFSNREIALLIWLFVFLIAMLFLKEARNFLSTTKDILFGKTFLIIYFLLASYLSAIILLLYKVNLWNLSDLKDSVFWLFAVGFVLIFQINKAKEPGYFKNIFISGFKWTIILEFVANLYSFSLLSEIFLLPFLTFIALTQTVADTDKKHKQISKLFSNILSFIGLGILSYSLYMTVQEYAKAYTLSTLNSLFLPTIITILFIPFVYFLALFVTYESFFTRISITSDKTEEIKEAKKWIIRIANINLEKLIRISSRFQKMVFYDDSDIKSYIIQISKKEFVKN